MEVYEGYLIRTKYYPKSEGSDTLRGVSLLCRQDPLSEKDDKWFGLWFNPKQPQRYTNYLQFKEALKEAEKADLHDYPIKIHYEVNDKGYNDIDKFEITPKPSKSAIDKALENESVTIESPNGFSKASQAESKPDKKPYVDKPDWDKIAEGKVRHGVAIAFIEKGEKLTLEIKKEINEWVKFIMEGE